MKRFLIISFCFIFILTIVGPVNASASTTYVDRGLTNTIVPHQLRNKIVTKKISTKNTYSKWNEVGTYNNKKSKSKATFSYSYGTENSRTFSLGANVSKEVLGHEVAITIGHELAWSKTETLNGSKTVPAKRMAYAYIRYKTSKVKYKHMITPQMTNVYGKWVNDGHTKTSYSTVTTKTPEITIKIKKN